MSWSTYFSQNSCVRPVDTSQKKRCCSIARPKQPEAQSPYYPDREVAKEQKLQKLTQETQWKEVTSYHEQHSQIIERNLKKINII